MPVCPYLARRENDVVGVVHDADLVRAAQVGLDAFQAGFPDQAVAAAGGIEFAVEGHVQLVEVVDKTAACRHLVIVRGAFRPAELVALGDDPAALGGEVGNGGHVGRRQAETDADQGLQDFRLGRPALFQVLLVDAVEELVIELQVVFLAVYLAEALHDTAEEGIEIGRRGAGNVLGQHAVEDAHRVVQVDRRVDHQDLLEVEAFFLLVQLGHEGRVGAPQAVAGDVEIGDLDLGLVGFPDLFHHLVKVGRVHRRPSRHAGGRGGLDEVGVGGRSQRDDMEAGAIQGGFHLPHLGGLMTAAGAGDDEDQRGGLVLGGDRVLEGAHRDRVGELAIGEDHDFLFLARNVAGHRGLVRLWCAQDGRHQRIGVGVTVVLDGCPGARREEERQEYQ